MSAKVRKAIIAAAGLGTRFLPQTKAMPKEMLPIVDKPVIQIIVEQLVAAGVTDIVIVTGYSKRAIEDHFDRSEDLEQELREKGKDELAKQLREIGNMANFVYLRQKGAPKGNARPIINAQHLLGNDEPFFVVFADDFFRAEVPPYAQLLEVYEQTGQPVISLVEVPKAEVKNYGMVAFDGKLDERTFKITQLVEKPEPEVSPSTFASVGSFLLTPEILPIIAEEKIGAGGEIVLADSLNELAQKTDVYGRVIEGIWHDAGSKERYLQAIVDYALVDPKLGDGFRAYLEERLRAE